MYNIHMYACTTPCMYNVQCIHMYTLLLSPFFLYIACSLSLSFTGWCIHKLSRMDCLRMYAQHWVRVEKYSWNRTAKHSQENNEQW